jgi:hypothetical protein
MAARVPSFGLPSSSMINERLFFIVGYCIYLYTSILDSAAIRTLILVSNLVRVENASALDAAGVYRIYITVLPRAADYG